jgi:transposase
MFTQQDAENASGKATRREWIGLAVLALPCINVVGLGLALEALTVHGQDHERLEVRNTRSRPLLESLKQWLEETLGKLSRKSDTARAVRYALGRWTALLRFCDDGGIDP